MDRLDVGANVAPHSIRLFFDVLARRVDTTLREGNLERDQIKQDRIAELIDYRFLGFGQDGELYDALLHCCDAIVKHADRA